MVPVAVLWVQAGKVVVALWAALMAVAVERMVGLAGRAAAGPLAAAAGPDMVAVLAVSVAVAALGTVVVAAVVLVAVVAAA